jgi:uncharacterized protein YkwD
MFALGLGPLRRSLPITAISAAMSLAIAWQPAAAAPVLALQLPGDPAASTTLVAEQALLALTNADRAANGVPPLDSDPDTLVIARQRATSQLDVPALSHYNADGDLAFVDLLATARVPYQLAGENLARAYDNDAAVTQRIEQALMRSPLHRKNILEHTFSKVAIGAATDGKGQITFAEVYRN